LNKHLLEQARRLALETERRERAERAYFDEKAGEMRRHSELAIEAQEAERRRIARDLHDSVNQLLSTVTFRLGMIAEHLSGGNREATEELAKAKILLAKGIEEIHRISEGLRPSELDSLGLVPAVRSLCHEFEEKGSLTLNLDIDVTCKRLPDPIELTVYRIIQEALNNIEKHSGASRANLHLKQNGSCLKLVIHDNGRGLQSAPEKGKTSKKGGMGFLNMRERATFLGGAFSIRSTPEKGTEIEVQIPLAGSVLDQKGTYESSGQSENKGPAS
jgi:two-component system NarL family sensor kinase